ncbi:MAG TPA: hypothetical protein VF647_22235 [Longimicrobium sp.]|jgi:hypothetical protein
MLKNETTPALPDLSNLPPDVQAFITSLAEDGITVWPMRPAPNRPLPEPLHSNTSLTAAVLEEREEYEW